jgi:hypothetical protein
MTIRVELNAEIEAQLVVEGSRPRHTFGKSGGASIAGSSGFSLCASRNLTLEGFHAMLSALSAGSGRLPNLPTESFTRESFYEDRA